MSEHSFTDQADNYLAALQWSVDATDYEKTLVAGNIRNFAHLISVNSAMDRSQWDSRCVHLEQERNALRQKIDTLRGELDEQKERIARMDAEGGDHGLST